MEKIKVTNTVTMKDVAKRIQYFSDRASEVRDLVSNDTTQCKREYTVLYKKQAKEYHELSLAKNYSILESNGALRAYRSYFGHLHFMKNVYKNLSWNLREFDQGKIWFEEHGRHFGD